MDGGEGVRDASCRAAGAGQKPLLVLCFLWFHLSLFNYKKPGTRI